MSSTSLTPRSLRHTAEMPRTSVPARFLEVEVDGQVRTFELRGELVRLGRGHRADLCFDDGTVSRRHALVLTRPDGTVELIDEASLSGTYVNGVRVWRSPLHDGDVIGIGRSEIRFRDVA